MVNMKIDHFVVGPVQTNCYFVTNIKTKEMIIIDPGACANQLAKKVDESGAKPFKGGSMSDLVRTVKEKIMTLPEHTEVYPGHNDTTTIENERMYNPYL